MKAKIRRIGGILRNRPDSSWYSRKSIRNTRPAFMKKIQSGRLDFVSKASRTLPEIFSHGLDEDVRQQYVTGRTGAGGERKRVHPGIGKHLQDSERLTGMPERTSGGTGKIQRRPEQTGRKAAAGVVAGKAKVKAVSPETEAV